MGLKVRSSSSRNYSSPRPSESAWLAIREAGESSRRLGSGAAVPGQRRLQTHAGTALPLLALEAGGGRVYRMRIRVFGFRVQGLVLRIQALLVQDGRFGGVIHVILATRDYELISCRLQSVDAQVRQTTPTHSKHLPKSKVAIYSGRT